MTYDFYEGKAAKCVESGDFGHLQSYALCFIDNSLHRLMLNTGCHINIECM